ncbi:MAG: hypothetical protein AAF351_15140 [Pseudomonadota bacterium]
MNLSYVKKTAVVFAVSLVVSLVMAVPASAERLIREFRGSASTLTDEFIVEGPWIVEWRMMTDYEFQTALDIALIDASNGSFIGGIKSGTRQNVTRPGSGIRMFDMDGRFKFRISSSFSRWHIKVIQLTEEEAERYTPVAKP